MRRTARPVWPGIARPLALLAAAAFSVSGLPGRAAAAEAVPEKKEDAKLKITFPPNVEAKLAKFLAKVKEAKRKLLKERMGKDIKDIVKTTNLNPERVKGLETTAQQVIELCLEEWMGKTDEMFRRELRQPVAMLAQILDQMLMQAELYANQDALVGNTQPTEQAAWIEALKRALSPEQNAAWEKAQAERLEAFQKEMGGFLKMTTDNTRQQYSRSILATTADMKRSLGLSKERAEKLDELAKNSADQSAAAWRKRAEQMLFQLEEAQRQALLKNRQFYLAPEPSERPDRQSMWKDGVARLLSADEFKRLEAAREERQSKRMRGMGMLMVTEFDDKVALTAIQRQRLQPLLTRMVNEEASLFSEEESDYSLAYSSQTFLAVGSRAKEQEMKQILDPIQWRHWREVCDQKNPAWDTESDGETEEKTEGAGATPQRIVEPEEFEAAISDYLYAKTVKEKNRMLPPMILKAEDAGRVAGLSEEAVERLETAARGASDKLLGDWKLSADQWIRSIVQGATAQSVKQRLRSIETYQLPRDNNMSPEKDAIWTGAVKTELTAAQTAAWTKAVDERSAYRNRAIALAVMSEFDRRVPMTPEQWDKLEPMITDIVNEYAPEISMMFGNGNFTPWYMQVFSIFVPFAALPEKDFKEVLGKENWERWTGYPEFANSRNYWTNIQQMHGMRPKKAK